METMQQTKENLLILCEIFKLGTLQSWGTENHNLKGYRTAKFKVCESEKIFEYIFKS